MAATVGISIVSHCLEVTGDFPPSARLWTETIGPISTMEKADPPVVVASSAIAGPSRHIARQARIARFLTPNLFVPIAEAMIAPARIVQAAIVASKAAVLSRVHGVMRRSGQITTCTSDNNTTISRMV